jgi:hypothetical protein
MATKDEITEFETRANKAGLKIAAVLREAGIDRSLWTRWKNGSVEPRLVSWRAVEAAAEKLGLKRAA